MPWKAVAPVAIIIAAMAAILLAMGRVPFCECGTITLWSGDIWSSENSQQFADAYSFTHIEHGIIFFWLLRFAMPKVPAPYRLTPAVLIEAGWEILENSPMVINRYREATISIGYTGDSVFNSAGDVLACILGFAIATRLSLKASLLIMLTFELFLAYWIRDNLFFSIVMLIYPIDAVKNWQMGM